MTKKVLLGMSGGLDSSYSVLALRDMGYEVLGATLVMHGYTDTSGARDIADALGVPFFKVDCRREFDETVKLYFAREYSRGRTPNPCVICNREVKFAKLLEEADRLGCDMIATGHYAGVRFENGRYFAVRGADDRKDQSYMLWNLTQDQLLRIVFPLEKLLKSDVRNDARKHNIASADAPESEDVCFLPDGDTAKFVAETLGALPDGDFVDESGKMLGRHKGLASYTIGQRRGLGISAASRIFVTDIDPVKNIITLGTDESLFRKEIEVGALNFQKLMPADGGELRLDVKVRYAAKPASASVKLCGDKATAVFDVPVRAAAPGQSAVFYDGDSIVFGGIIEHAK